MGKRPTSQCEPILTNSGGVEAALSNLPPNWMRTALGTLFEIQQGKALNPAARAGKSPRPFLRTANVFWGHLDLSKVDEMDFTKEEEKRLALRPGDLLTCEGGDIGRTALWRGEIAPCYHQNHLHRLRAKTADVEPSFYMYWLQAGLTLLNLYSGHGNKTTIPNLSKARLASFEVPLPPPEEQRAIARVLSTVQQAKEATEKVIAATRQLKQSMMRHLFTYGPVPFEQADKVELRETEIGLMPSHWEVVRLGAKAAIGNGSTPRRTDSRYWEKGTIPWLTSGKIHDGTIREADEFVTEKARSECHLPMVKRGSLLVAITGQGKTLGNSARLELDACISQHLAYVRIHDAGLLPDFVLSFLRSRYEELQAISRSGGSTKGALTCAFLKGFEIPLPPLREQDAIASHLNAVDSKLTAERARLSSLDTLFDSILHSLMSGKVRVSVSNGNDFAA